MNSTRIRMPASPQTPTEFPAEFVRSGRFLLRGIGSQLVCIDLASCAVSWEGSDGPGNQGPHDSAMWGSEVGTQFAVVGRRDRTVLVRGYGSESSEQRWSSVFSCTDTRLMWASIVDAPHFDVAVSACVLNKSDALAVLATSHPLTVQRVAKSTLHTHLSSRRPIVEVVRIDPASGEVMWRTKPVRAACHIYQVHDRYDTLAFDRGTILSLDWGSGEWDAVGDMPVEPERLVCCGNVIGAAWRERGGFGLQTIDLRDGAIHVQRFRKRGVKCVDLYPAGGGDALLVINARTVGLMNQRAELQWQGSIGSHVYGVIGEGESPVFVDTAGAGSALYAFERRTGKRLIYARSAMGYGGDLTRVHGTDLVAVALAIRRSHDAGRVVVARVDGTGLHWTDIPGRIVSSYCGAVCTEVCGVDVGTGKQNHVLVSTLEHPHG